MRHAETELVAISSGSRMVLLQSKGKGKPAMSLLSAGWHVELMSASASNGGKHPCEPT